MRNEKWLTRSVLLFCGFVVFACFYGRDEDGDDFVQFLDHAIVVLALDFM
jgi:hypothetical protein